MFQVPRMQRQPGSGLSQSGIITMANSWGPTRAGKLFTTTPDWSLTLHDDRFSLNVAGLKSIAANILTSENIEIKPGVVWSSVEAPFGPGKVIRLDGIPNEDATWMQSTLLAARVEFKRKAQVQMLLSDLTTSLQPAVQWAADAAKSSKSQLRSHGWLTAEFSATLEMGKPTKHMEAIREPEVVDCLSKQPETFQAAVRLWARNTGEFTNAINERHIAKELVENKQFFDKVERSPLTEEQARAVICFDNRVLLVASAGSGKTSTIVAKAGYALMKGYVRPEQMLLLTFNNAGAAELRERVKERLSKLGLPAERVIVRTFHAFGLEVIGAATGKKPSLAPWLEGGEDLRTLLEIIEQLKRDDILFRSNWQFFRFVLSQDLPAFGKENDNPDTWDSVKRQSGFQTLNNETVKSLGEKLIADWLFFNGVEYSYEAPYKFATADAAHRQYHPDFYLPGIDTYLEHWALDDSGHPPDSFSGYREGMEWKKQLHQANGTTLLETTFGGLWSGKAFEYLEQELKKRGVALNHDPDRPVPGRKPIENSRLAKTFRSFLSHVKSNRLNSSELNKRLSHRVSGPFTFRHKLFIKLFEKIYAAWEARLKAENCIDFEDMLNMAVDHIEDGTWTGSYQVVMVDEFQDSSQARARLAIALVARPGRCLFAVGDDWQSINRFAGADINVMTDFESRYVGAKVMHLETTFRCPQTLCDISSAFIQKNPKQLRKNVSAVNQEVVTPIRIVRAVSEANIHVAIAKRIDEIRTQCLSSGKKATVLVLGRYQVDSKYYRANSDHKRLTVAFRTVHSSKGLEADHVILPRLTSEVLGFPSRVADDPVLQIAMPDGDDYEYGEERRLFYVALTRAKQSVTIVTIENKESPFVQELHGDFQVPMENADGTKVGGQRCECGKGFLVRRNSRYGPFYGCSTFPSCLLKRKILDFENDFNGHKRDAEPKIQVRKTRAESATSGKQVPTHVEQTSKIPFRVIHRKFGNGAIVDITTKKSKTSVIVRYDEDGKGREHDEAIFCGNGEYFLHRGEEAALAMRDFLNARRQQALETYGSNVDVKAEVRDSTSAVATNAVRVTNEISAHQKERDAEIARQQKRDSDKAIEATNLSSPAGDKTQYLRQLLWDGSLTYKQLLDIGDRMSQFSFTDEDVVEVRRQQVAKCSHTGYNSFIVYSRTDGQD